MLAGSTLLNACSVTGASQSAVPFQSLSTCSQSAPITVLTCCSNLRNLAMDFANHSRISELESIKLDSLSAGSATPVLEINKTALVLDINPHSNIDEAQLQRSITHAKVARKCDAWMQMRGLIGTVLASPQCWTLDPTNNGLLFQRQQFSQHKIRTAVRPVAAVTANYRDS